ncbi:MAG: lipid IV(A) palmitoyltransferase PagP [Methylophilaceae bacterium]
MKKYTLPSALRSALVSVVVSVCAAEPAYALCDNSDSILDKACSRVSDTWTQGSNDLYLPFHSHHLRFAYSQEKIDSFRENTWGLGYGRSRFDDNNNWDGLYGMVFYDSHSKPEYILGYSHQWILGAPERLHAGLGYTAFLTARSDLHDYIPLPGILPVASLSYNKASVTTAYVPGGSGNGNVLFFWSTLSF